MKKMLLLAATVFMMMLTACTQDNTCIKQIVEVINQGAQQHHDLENGTIDYDSLKEGELFQMPGGNLFANEQIWKIIEANADYKLTDADKEMLSTAVEQFTSDGDDIPALANNAMVLNAKGAIDTSKTLKDLYAHGGRPF